MDRFESVFFYLKKKMHLRLIPVHVKISFNFFLDKYLIVRYFGHIVCICLTL